MSKWIVRNVALSFALWAICVFVLISGLEFFVFDRFEPLEYVASVIGLGIGFTVAMPRFRCGPTMRELSRTRATPRGWFGRRYE